MDGTNFLSHERDDLKVEFSEKDLATVDISKNKMKSWDSVDNCNVPVYSQGNTLFVYGLAIKMTEEQMAEVRSFFEDT